MRFLQRHMNRHLLGELDGDDFLGAALNFEAGKPTKEADPVLEMHERITVCQFGEVEELIDLRDGGAGGRGATAHLARLTTEILAVSH